MTAADVTGWLDRLAETHKAATGDGPWRAVDNADHFDPECRYEILDDEGTVAVCTGDNDGATNTTGADRVAAIVAAHNALPQLVAAVRGVLALAEADDKIRGDYGYRIRNGLDPSPGDRIRTAVSAAALGAEVTGR